MSKQSRDFYLEQVWSRYPTPVLGGVCGRLIKIDSPSVNKNNNTDPNYFFFEFLDEYGKKILQKLDLKTALWFSSEEQQSPIQVLNKGDWIQAWYQHGNPMEGLGLEYTENFSSIDDIAIADVKVKKVLLLSPCLRQDYLSIADQDLYRNWIAFLNRIRGFFMVRRFDEIKTPTLVACPGTEPFLEPFVTEFKFGQLTQKYYLPTSPELSLKKCLAQGWTNIFEIRPCFRNGERSEWHLSEFYMLEWYRSFVNLSAIKNDICILLEELKFPEWEKSKLISLSMADLFEKYLQFELKPETTAAELLILAQKINLNVDAAWDFDDIFYLLYVEKIEPRLSEFDFLFLEKYPPSQAALARLTQEGWGERFEFYIKGVEIANAFNELNDPQVQRQRFLEDLEKKRKHSKSEVPLDEEFLLHLEQGMPPASGIALGLERLFMMYYNIQDIRKIVAY